MEKLSICFTAKLDWIIKPRQSRIDAPRSWHHIIARGIGRREIFNDDQERDNFVKRLESVLEQTRTGCYAWVLISMSQLAHGIWVCLLPQSVSPGNTGNKKDDGEKLT